MRATHRAARRRSRDRREDEGAVAVLVAITLIPLVMGLAVVVDSGRAWAERAALQNAVEVTTASAAIAWMTTGAVCPAASLAYLTRDDATPDGHTCTTTGTSKNGTITVRATDATPLYFAGLIGRPTAALEASTTARIGSVGSLANVWPIALCDHHPSLIAWRDSGYSLTTNYVISMQGSTNYCGGNAGGNWGVLDFNGGQNSTGETTSWVTSGWPELLDVGDVVTGNPGGVTGSMGIQQKVGSTILIPLFDHATLTGSNATYRISGFARATLVAAHLSGAAGSRSLTVRFQTGIVDRESGSGGIGSGGNYGITSWAICAHDQTGACS